MNFNKKLYLRILNFTSIFTFTFSTVVMAADVPVKQHLENKTASINIMKNVPASEQYANQIMKQNQQSLEEVKEANDIKSVIINWKEIPGAVKYELCIRDADTKEKVFTKYDIYASGYQVDSSEVDFSKKLIWQVRGLNYNKVPVSDYTHLKWLNKGKFFADNWQVKPVSTEDIEQQDNYKEEKSNVEYTTYIVKNNTKVNPIKLTTQFADMSFMPVYPVYSWVPVKNAKYYDIDVFKIESDGNAKKLESLHSAQNTMDYYDIMSYTTAGKYYFNVQAYDLAKQKIAQSKNSYFTVTTDNINIAALGDSITHGGGAISTPPSAILYNWETYANLPILNIGFSGNTTSNMLNRFDKDVIPFSPKLLIIMGGVNDIRTGIKADTVINNLQKIKEKCKENNITPVFLTVTPINPVKMETIGKIEKPDINWQKEREKINNWVRSQDYYVDVAENMADEKGYLKDNLTTDGLHPDYEGKKQIGEAVGEYIRLYFPHLL